MAVRRNDLPTSKDDRRLQGWYHTIELGKGLVSKGVFDHRSVVDRYGIPATLRGKEALDVGAGDGFFSFEMERRGADRVMAVDLARLGDADWVEPMHHRLGDLAATTSWPTHLRMAKLMLGSRVEQKFCNVYDISPYTVGTFDVVFCASLLLHLQNPLRALQAIRSVTREVAIIETAIWPDFETPEHAGRPLMTFGYPGEEEHPGETTSYWVFSTAALKKMLLYAGFKSVEVQDSFLLPPVGPFGAVMIARPG